MRYLTERLAARPVTKAKRRDHITPVLRQLHWLPINQRIVFKVLLITFKITNGYAPSYLSSLLESYKPKGALRSATKRHPQLHMAIEQF